MKTPANPATIRAANGAAVTITADGTAATAGKPRPTGPAEHGTGKNVRVVKRLSAATAASRSTPPARPPTAITGKVRSTSTAIHRPLPRSEITSAPITKPPANPATIPRVSGATGINTVSI